MVEAILWDNDGVLVDTEGLCFAATRDTLARAQVVLTRDVYLDFVMGNGRSVFELAEARGSSPDAIAALRAERDAAFAALLRSAPSLAIDGIVETLQALHGRTRMAIVTTAPREHFELAHRRTGMRRFFEVVVAREDYEQSKPHPEPYLTALRRLGLRPDRCVAIEDSERGLTAATRAGLRCIIIPNDFTRGCDFSGAAAVLADSRAILATLASLQAD
jgi:HAD superfamily hydrolase (TIGR01509 family)